MDQLSNLREIGGLFEEALKRICGELSYNTNTKLENTEANKMGNVVQQTDNIKIENDYPSLDGIYDLINGLPDLPEVPELSGDLSTLQDLDNLVIDTKLEDPVLVPNTVTDSAVLVPKTVTDLDKKDKGTSFKMKFPCDLCGKEYKWQSSLCRHKRSRHIDGFYLCPVESCQARLSRKDYVNVHILRCHKK